MRALVDVETDVVIVGAGPVGLAAAIELGKRGVRCIVVERNDRVGYSPRAKTTNVRSREHLRRWGIADALRRVPYFAESSVDRGVCHSHERAAHRSLRECAER